MIICECGKRINNIGDVNFVRFIGFSPFANCSKCGVTISIQEIFRIKRFDIWTGIVKTTRKSRVKKVRKLDE